MIGEHPQNPASIGTSKECEKAAIVRGLSYTLNGILLADALQYSVSIRTIPLPLGHPSNAKKQLSLAVPSGRYSIYGPP